MPRPFCVWVLAAGKLFPATKHCGDHARASTAINYSYNPEGYFVWSIGNQIASDYLEAKRTGSKVGSPETLVRHEHQRIECGNDLAHHAIGSAKIKAVDILVDFVQVFDGFRVKCEAHQAIDLCRAAARSFNSRQASAPSTS